MAPMVYEDYFILSNYLVGLCKQVKEYVTTRKGLKRVCLLVDAKWGLKPRDDELIYLMEKYLSCQSLVTNLYLSISLYFKIFVSYFESYVFLNYVLWQFFNKVSGGLNKDRRSLSYRPCSACNSNSGGISPRTQANFIVI